MSLQITVFAHDRTANRDSVVVVEGYTRDQSEAIAEALGLASAYGIANPVENGDYEPEDVVWELVNVEKLYEVSTPEITKQELVNLIKSGFILTNHPSY